MPSRGFRFNGIKGNHNLEKCSQVRRAPALSSLTSWKERFRWSKFPTTARQLLHFVYVVNVTCLFVCFVLFRLFIFILFSHAFCILLWKPRMIWQIFPPDAFIFILCDIWCRVCVLLIVLRDKSKRNESFDLNNQKASKICTILGFFRLTWSSIFQYFSVLFSIFQYSCQTRTNKRV